MQENYYASMFVEDFLNNYFATNPNMSEFPADEQLEDMYDQLVREYYDTQAQGTDVDIQRFNDLLWLILIGSLYRRYPYYRRCRGRRCRPRPRPRPRPKPRPYGYNTKDLMGQIRDKLDK